MGLNEPKLSRPAPLEDHHELNDFCCGEPSLDSWLKQRARRGGRRGTAQTFVVCDGDTRVIGYYALHTGAVVREMAPKAMQRNTPNHLPVLVMGRLGIDLGYQRRGIGEALLKDAMLRTLNVSNSVGCMALLVEALSEGARDFYKRYSFVESPVDDMVLFLPIGTIRESLG